MNSLHGARVSLVVGLLLSLGGVASVWAASARVAASPEAVYRRERADCLQGRSAQDRQTCLREAAAVLADARRGLLRDVEAQVLAQNALRRCQRVPAEDRLDCERLARGEGQQSGSVAEGAILKQITTLQFEAPAAGAPASAASSPS